jgi:ParB family chromosome partitioning protein
VASESARPRGLGQGLSVLLRDVRPLSEGDDNRTLLQIPVGRIRPNPRQPRVRIDEEAFTDLVASVKRDGVVQPVLVRPTAGGDYELIAGERRWRAAKTAGLAVIPAVPREVDDRTSLALAVVENVVRTDLTAIEQGRAYARLMDEFRLSQGEVAEAVGRSRVSVSNMVRLLDLPDEVLEAIERGVLSEGHGRAILQVDDHDNRRQLGALAIRRELTVRDTEAAARKLGRPVRRRVRGPRWFDADLAHDAVDAVYRALALPARVVSEGDGCRVEIKVRSVDDLTRLVARLDALGEAPAMSAD